MKSPITGKEMTLIKEKKSMNFRKETFEVIFHYYKCEDSGETFTTTALDNLNISQVYNQYRDKHNIPFPEEIKKIREKYGVSATKMSEILGFGVNTYRQYEAGEIPSSANARLIQVVNEPEQFISMLKLCDTFDDKQKEKYINKALSLLEYQNRESFASLKNYLLGEHLADIYSGYKNPNLNKFAEMVIYFADKTQPFKTKMNKLLFYADFLMFKQTCFSISGIRYKAREMGPVPYNFQSIFEYLTTNGYLDISYVQFNQGYVGEQFSCRKDRKFNADLFSEEELNVLEKVASFFKSTKTNEIIEFSHKEKAWINNIKNKDIISYEYAFELSEI
ncbi:putative zinc finger/helix-turn-helix protein, YgiT family [Flexibacter flexilis DSM 6793]|uniref:Putative zinc finger/helix-turn-helix protein, YgiT family n=1 Tax=Flexibacter flexilis DSM 6793 TaxID=927664 RepID=A0A1I1H6L6_9BACT|nr:type II TA system antitoxin MqsA family protein [Flexibacter flexilis]SFC19222.1 putative zinc finger/helix-turn-helix protein, YgiT family [Flexibacter flexilis DSM 6793]